MPINDYEFLNIQACSFHVVWNRGCTQSLVVSCKYWVVLLVYTRVSGYSQVILLEICPHWFSEWLGDKQAIITCSIDDEVLNQWCCQGTTLKEPLTHWGRDKMAAISQTTLSNAFSWKKIFRISIKVSLKFVPKGPINNFPALVEIMAWHQPGDKPLSETMMDSVLTHICVIRPQWVKKNWWIRWILRSNLVTFQRCDMAFIEPMHRNKPNITYLLTCHFSE